MQCAALVEKLKSARFGPWKIVIMPHFCLDNLIHFEGDFSSFAKSLKSTEEQGGGNIAVSQSQQVGGKAANCANALSALGVLSHLIAKTDEIGIIILKHFLKGSNVDISHVKSDGELAITSSIELDSANIMLSDAGSLSRFGPDLLSDEDQALIEEADLVCISDWGLNIMGTDLVRHVFTLVKENGRGSTFFDPGDPSPKGKGLGEEVRALVKEVLGKGLVDILSLNLKEAEILGGVDFLRTLTRLDIHTKDYSRSLFGFRETKPQPVFSVSPLRLTGAGDAWNAGDILGEMLRLSDEQRLLLANAVAAYYISSPQDRHPTRSQLVEFLEVHETSQ